MRQFDETLFVGKEVIHTKFGKGKIISANQSCVSVSFDIGVKDLSIEVAFADGKKMKFTDVPSQNLVEEIINENKAEKQEEERVKKEAAEAKRRAEEEERKTKASKKSNKSGRSIWIKFEGAQDKDRMANIHVVTQNGAPWYVLHYSKRPINVNDGDSFFLAEGVIDDQGKRHQIITARGHLYAFNESNYSPDSWIKEHPWIPSHPWYVVIKDCEVLDASIKHGLKLERVISAIGSETYLATSGLDKDYDYLMHLHNRRAHMMLTEASEEFINHQFDNLVKKYGSKTYKTEL